MESHHSLSGETRLYLLPDREAKLRSRCRRTVVFVFRVSLPQKRKMQEWLLPFLHFWSKWRDSNSRHPAPKELLELFSNNLCSFLAPFIPDKLLFRTLVSTVSVCSKTEYGQKCGHIQTLPGSKVNRGAFSRYEVW